MEIFEFPKSSACVLSILKRSRTNLFSCRRCHCQPLTIVFTMVDKKNILALQQLTDLLVLLVLCYDLQNYFELVSASQDELVQEMANDIDKVLTQKGYRERTNFPRRQFSEIVETVDDRTFKRMFRMNKEWFLQLVNKIEATVSPAVFKSEAYLMSNASCTQAATATVGGFISGEVKIALTIRILAGASYLDLMLLYGVKRPSLYRAFHEGIRWINESFTFPLGRWIKDQDTAALNELANGFADRSDGVFFGCIGALDGIAIRIDSPTMKEDENPGQYFCRKGFFALNAQCICDASKRILWLSTGHIGSSHDSSAFSNTHLYKLLEENADFLHEHGFFLAGDSAYPLLSFLITPYSNAESHTPQDDFNFWHSSSRITIECSFGEIVMRWGILWRKLLFSLKDVGKVINAAFLLHNFIIAMKTEQDHLDDVMFYGRFNVLEEDAFQVPYIPQVGQRIPRLAFVSEMVRR